MRARLMIQGIFINVPVGDIKKSRKFFEAIGFKVSDKYTGPSSVCLGLADTVKVMLSDRNQFEKMLGKPAADPKTSEVLITLTCSTAVEVKTITEKALSQGARRINDFEENEFMYSWAFEDLNRHLWDLHCFK